VEPKLTPVAIAELKHGQEMTAKGQIYDDNLSTCGPAGFPRWLTEPFMREQIVTPDETWVLTEQANEIRRIYTDGRGTRQSETAIPCRRGTRSASGRAETGDRYQSTSKPAHGSESAHAE